MTSRVPGINSSQARLTCQQGLHLRSSAVNIFVFVSRILPAMYNSLENSQDVSMMAHFNTDTQDG